MNDLTTRKDARNALVTLLQGIAALQEVYDHETLDFENQSPVATVQSAGQHPQFQGNVNIESHQFLVEVYVNREDADAAEDLIDDLALSIAQVIKDWHNAFFFQGSQTFYEVINGIPYRGESHYIQVDWE